MIKTNLTRTSWRVPFLLVSALLVSALLVSASCSGEAPDDAGAATAASADYQYVEPSRDGIGKVYMGREISHVMGHRGAGWLERSSRVKEERTDLLLDNLPVQPDSVIVDLGAGTGYFSAPMAKRATAGRVLAVDLQTEMLEIIAARSERENIDNIEPVLATEQDPNLPPDTVDLVLIVDAYHEFSHPREVLSRVFTSLKPGGRIYLVEYRGEDPQVPIKPLHKMTQAQARLELEDIGLRWVETLDFLPQQHVLVFERPQ
jgi:SAM-dependent methyltransferase